MRDDSTCIPRIVRGGQSVDLISSFQTTASPVNYQQEDESFCPERMFENKVVLGFNFYKFCPVQNRCGQSIKCLFGQATLRV